ncbi:hypothetical protein M407DRAFT_140486 [Tulasnella calospora MUT 4182]|uniref:Uncharacterized protein n=1 Tax=Tulasnella calospora MUT 4182 TaxID=1051891 RepID=A0A0C3Q8N2_9AGAM|nr:hypothetical protein M407DRAFT_140486 [Tulasnella calospora MUT 4182]
MKRCVSILFLLEIDNTKSREGPGNESESKGEGMYAILCVRLAMGRNPNRPHSEGANLSSRNFPAPRHAT